MSLILKSLFVCLLLAQPVIADDYSKPIITITPELEKITIDGDKVYVMKDTKEPYTGTTSITNSARNDVVVKKEYVNGVADDIVIFYHSSGVKLSGEVEFPYPDGSKHKVVRLTRGILDGVSKSWYPSGVLKSKDYYTLGSKGDYTIYYKSGNKRQTRDESFGGLKEVTSWHESGERKRFLSANNKGVILTSKQWDSRGRKHGLWVDRYDDGPMHKRKHYTHGIPSNAWIVWYKNGNKNIEVRFTDGLLNGPFKFWNEKGVAVIDGMFENSKEVGLWIFKDNDGNSIRRPKDLNINIIDDGESIVIVGQANEAIYMSIYMPLALALLVLLPLLGVGFYWLYRRLRDKKRNNQGVNV